MPVRVKKIKGKYCAVDQSGKPKKGRCHSDKKTADKQVFAINKSIGYIK